MKAKIFMPVIMILLTVTVYPQKTIRNYMHLSSEMARFNESVIDMPEYTGSPYLDKEFSDGSFVTVDNILYKNIPLRYNIYNEIFEFEKDNAPFDLDPKRYGRRVTCNDMVFIYTDYTYNKNPKKGYLEILEKGNYSLFKRYKVRYDRPEPAGAYSDTKPGNFAKLQDEYFFQAGEEGEIRFIPKEGEFLDYCGEHAVDVKAYMKKNKLKIRKEDQLIKIMNYLNTL